MQMQCSDFFLLWEDIISSAATGWKPWGSRFPRLPAPLDGGAAAARPSCHDCTELGPPHKAAPKAPWAEGSGCQWDWFLLKDKGHVTPQSSWLQAQSASFHMRQPWQTQKSSPITVVERPFNIGHDCSRQLQRLPTLERVGFWRIQEKNNEENVSTNDKPQLTENTFPSCHDGEDEETPCWGGEVQHQACGQSNRWVTHVKVRVSWQVATARCAEGTCQNRAPAATCPFDKLTGMDSTNRLLTFDKQKYSTNKFCNNVWNQKVDHQLEILEKAK